MTAAGTARIIDEGNPYHEVTTTPAFAIPPQAQSLVATDASETAPNSSQLAALSRGQSPLPVGLPVPLPQRTHTQPQFHALQKWQGSVSKVTDSTFDARLLDLKDPSVEEVAEFDLEEVSVGDRPLVVPGAVFYWSVGYRTEPSGSRSRTSVLVFRRLPAWSEKDLRRADDRVRELRNSFGW